jgi:tetratricopeptide (TPR) repeat protein
MHVPGGDLPGGTVKVILGVSALILLCAATYADSGPAGHAAARSAVLAGSAASSPGELRAVPPAGSHPERRERRKQQAPAAVPGAPPKPAPPAVLALTAEDFFRAGMQKYYGQDYGAAVSLLCQYVSLFPNDSQVSGALFVIGKGYETLKRPLAALGVFGRIIARFPHSQEALWSVVAIADIGLGNPALNYPPFESGFEYLRDPIGAYDALLARKIPPPMVEEVMLRKGRALYRKERYGESFATFSRLLGQNPAAPARQEAISAVKASAEIMLDQYVAGGDHLAAANFYFQARRRGLIGLDDLEMTVKAVISLARLGCAEEAADLLDALRTKSRGKGTAQLSRAAAEIQNRDREKGLAGRPPPAQWALFQEGREQLAANEQRLAAETLARLKTADGDSFWARLVDYVLAEKQWRDKYQRYFTGHEKP